MAILGLLGAVWSTMGLSLPAAAQLPYGDLLPKIKPTERQSQQNPAGKAHGDTTNRGRMSADFLWGVTNANKTFNSRPYTRVPEETENAPLQLDGFTYPYPTRNGRRFRMDDLPREFLFPGRKVDNEPFPPNVLALAQPVAGGLGNVGGFSAGLNWGFAAAPSGNGSFIGGGYHRSAATPRAAAPLPDPADLVNTADKFMWYPNVPGAPGEYARYAIRVHIPEPAPDGSGENRINDARYVVYYVVPVTGSPNTFIRKRKVVTVAQDSAGDKWLVGDDGKPAYFPMLSENTYTALAGTPYASDPAGLTLGDPRARARVELDNSTENEGDNLYVIADQVEFVQRPQTMKAAPIVTPAHGGRKVDTTQVVTPTQPYQQPAGGPNYGLSPLVLGGGVEALLNDSFAFINNPRDPAYTTVGDPLFGQFDPANPSVLFRGPASLADPRGDPTAGTATYPDPWNGDGKSVAGVDAYNHMQYRNAAGGAPVPFFSHLQVLIARTEFLVDPETGVAPADQDGTRTIEVGSIYSVDWLTGTPLWRFPDRTYLPAGTNHPNGTAITGGGLRNPQIGTNPLTSQPIYLVPGISASDRNGNGTFEDDEIFLVGQGNNPSGGLSSAITIVPNIRVMGDVQIPTYQDLGGGSYSLNGVTPAPTGRYAVAAPALPAGWAPVYMPVAFFGGDNGVLYAIDPFGNNDNQYIEKTSTTELGTFRPGTTNLLWTFSPQSAPRKRTATPGFPAEALDTYYRRQKEEIPVPGGFGGSSPVVAWAKQEDDATLDRSTQEPRLFVGNQNGILYALDPRADAGAVAGTLRTLPFRKGEQVPRTDPQLNTGVPEAGAYGVSAYRQDLKWWFETLGPINGTPAISDVAFARNATAPVTASKRVFITSGEGRVYSLDWDGPVLKMDHERNVTWDGTGGNGFTRPTVPAGTTVSAAVLNDNSRFHNEVPARVGARPDLTEGTIRPVWAHPNRYADISDTGGPVDNRIGIDLPDTSKAYPSARLAVPQTSLSALYNPAVLMDIAATDRDSGVTGLTGIRRYVVIAANDFNSESPNDPKQGRLLLLDQEGDRNDFLSNPMPTRASGKFNPTDPAINTARPGGSTGKPTPAAGSAIYGQPLDQFVSKLGPFGNAAPVWTYRLVYDLYVAGQPDLTLRNLPAVVAPLANPARRPLPTIFVGGVGRLYAVDIDDETGLLLRWRAAGTAQPTPLPANYTNADIPGDDANADLLNPGDPNNVASPVFNVGNQATLNLATKRILARTIPLRGDPSSVDGQIVVTGGPNQNHNNFTAQAAANALPDTSAPAVVFPNSPGVPLLPTLDAPVTKPILTYEPVPPANPPFLPFGYNLIIGSANFPILPIIDLTGRYQNLDIDDPLTTLIATYPENINPIPGSGFRRENNSYQYPVLMVTTQQSTLHEVSTNIEGEDRPSVASVGWAFVEGDIERYNPRHTLHVEMDGPGGVGGGIAVLTNAYFPSLDTSYARRPDFQGKQAADPSLPFAFYPKEEPNNQVSTFGDTPRPHFKPRSLYEGNAANGAATPAIPAVAPDTHTGRTGFPLDLNGLFYDKQFAYDPAAAAAIPNNNAQGKLRLPGYSRQGVRAGSTVTTGTPETDFNRVTLVNASGGTAVNVGNNDNPAGQNVTWIYAGGDDGLLYAYTPVFAPRLGGRSSGFRGGRRVIGSDETITSGVQARVDIFPKDVFDNLRASALGGAPQRPDPFGNEGGLPNTLANAKNIAASGGKNFYEWGESVYIIVWDVPVVGNSRLSDPVPAVPNSFSVTLRVASATGAQGQTVTRTVPLERAAGVVSTYPLDPSFAVPAGALPPGYRQGRAGIAFYEFRLQPGAGLSMTPGARLQISVQAGPPTNVSNQNTRTAVVVGGPTDAAVMANSAPQFVVANPLGVQGFVAETRQGYTPALPFKPSGEPIAGGIGPFQTPGTGDPGMVKRKVAGQGTTAAMDPDRTGYEYSQALSNGNTVQRFDLDPYVLGAGSVTRNRNYGRRLKQSNGGDDPDFFIPVVAGAGYVGHGRTGSTDLTNAQRNLRVVNRAFNTMSTLTRIRAEVVGDLIWRWWPGQVPNADVDDNNLRITPTGMSHDGRINPLPWEVEVGEARPWDAQTQNRQNGSSLKLGNISPDYPDIVAASSAQQGRQAISVQIGGGDAVQGAVSLPNAQLNIGGNAANVINPILNPAQPGYSIFPAAINVRVPQFQPANLVANHSLTSTYEQVHVDDGVPVFVGTGGKLQLPRGTTNRELRLYNPGSGLFDGSPAIAPFGYTTRVRVFVDAGSGTDGADNNGRYDVGEPYRMVEVWFGVPVDMGLKSNETPVDLGALPAGFGMQNGLNGYNPATPNPGFLPSPIAAPYQNYFKKFTVQNTGNVNLYNLRAAQKIEPLTSPALGTGSSYFFFGLQSETVDPSFGILSIGADPLLGASPFKPANVMPQIVTSLDQAFDTFWDAYYAGLPWMAQDSGNGVSVYNRYYAVMRGRHSFGKSRVGSSEPSVLGFPDLPRSSALLPVTAPLQPDSTSPVVGVAVPVGTPVGVYRSNGAVSVGGMPPQLSVFEDHDTVNADTGNVPGYAPVPVLTGAISGGGRILRAGPTYNGQNGLPPGAAGNVIQPAAGEGVLRVRNVSVSGGTPNAEFLPHTNPAIDLKVTVSETPLSGQIGDFALSAFGLDGIMSGLLPGLDPFPILENTASGLRPASAVSPAAYRTGNGNLHVYFVRNAQVGGVGDTAAGSPFRLFHSHMTWNASLGVFQAFNAGVPVADPSTSTGQWFSPPAELVTTAGDSNLYPSVLQIDPTFNEATLFWINSQPRAGSLPIDTIWFASLNGAGVPGVPRQLLTNPDPTIRRYGPRAAFDATTATGVVLYYGGAPGKMSLYYTPYRGGPRGIPLGAGAPRGSSELPLSIPASLTSASEPTGVVRRMRVPDQATGNVDDQTPVLDVYYTGVLRTTQTPDLCMTRYRMVGGGGGVRLVLAALPAVQNERLVQKGRDLAWQARHIGWTTAFVPTITLVGAGGTVSTVANAWQLDNASKQYIQTIQRPGGVLYIYLDMEAGQVTFRGAGAPGTTDIVLATYQPTTYRLTPDSAADTGGFATVDTRVQLATTAGTGLRNGVVRRAAPLPSRETDIRLSGVGRQWTMWTKGAQPNRAAHLYFAARRVGIDLKSVTTTNPLARAESFLLSDRDAAGNQVPQVTVNVQGVGPVPFDVDIATGRIYVDPFYEGLAVDVAYTATQGAPTTNRNATASGRLAYIEELAPSDMGSMGLQVPMLRSVNESQPYGFIDLYNYDPTSPILQGNAGSGRVGNSPAAFGDPTLVPGRFWMFWTSSRGRGGKAPVGGSLVDLPSGFDLYYQTLAPNFEIPSFTAFPQ